MQATASHPVAQASDTAANSSDRSRPEWAKDLSETEIGRRLSLASSFDLSVGLRFATAKFATFSTDCIEQERALDSVMGYATNFPQHKARGAGMVIYGPPGTGKDHLAIAALRMILLTHGVDVMWAHGLELFAELRAGIDSERSENEVVRSYIKAGVLCLSDPVPPAGTVTPWQAAQLGRIIDRRWRAMLPTIVTMNVADGGEAGDKLGQAAVDRLRHDSLCIACNWPSHRKASR